MSTTNEEVSPVVVTKFSFIAVKSSLGVVCSSSRKRKLNTAPMFDFVFFMTMYISKLNY
jgi:hypothetical protein